MKCKFNEPWVGTCDTEETGEYCNAHSGLLCGSCGAQATHGCDSTGQFVCGEYLCDNCEHTIFPDGTNGVVGFNAAELPEGLGRHIRKSEQRFTPWYTREKQ